LYKFYRLYSEELFSQGEYISIFFNNDDNYNYYYVDSSSILITIKNL
jgi:hypothetical protein